MHAAQRPSWILVERNDPYSGMRVLGQRSGILCTKRVFRRHVHLDSFTLAAPCRLRRQSAT